MTASTALPPCPPDCNRDCASCREAGRRVTATAERLRAQVQQWRQSGGWVHGSDAALNEHTDLGGAA